MVICGKGIVLSVGLTLMMILILSIILSLTNVKESVIMPSVIFMSSFSIMIGGFFVARHMEKRGILYGSIVGVLYMVILYTISSFLNFNFSLNLNAIIMVFFGVLGGAIGGVLGINLK